MTPEYPKTLNPNRTVDFDLIGFVASGTWIRSLNTWKS